MLKLSTAAQGRYSGLCKCLTFTNLSTLNKPDLLLDIHLHDHVTSLYQKIRSKALVQYFSPFISVDLNVMASAFNTDVLGLEKELSGLIMEGSIEARIDSHNKVGEKKSSALHILTCSRRYCMLGQLTKGVPHLNEH